MEVVMARFRGIRSLTAGAGLAIGSLALVASTAGAATVPSLTATPNTHLINHQVVEVAGAALPAGAHLYVAECLRSATSEAGCDLTTAVAVTITAKGLLRNTNFTVTTGAVGPGKCGTTKRNANHCRLVIGSGTGTAYAGVDISFTG
jgi:hypothetical protein